ncbi:MAG: RluA family pseudouridine synthase [Myxococcota bacterium]
MRTAQTTSPRLLTHRDGLAFVDKPAGMPTHRTAEGRPDLIGWLKTQGRLLRDARPVHRLDASTSGVILCADRARRAEASGWFERHAVEKVYLALVYGRMRPSGTISVPIDDQPAITDIVRESEMVCGGQILSLLALRPQTGRTHQLRRHLLHIRHPILGDPRYRSRRHPSLPDAPDRLWLHAARLTVPGYPTVEAPLPDALATHLARCQAPLPGAAARRPS